MLGLLGAWSTWNELRSPRFGSYQPPPSIEVGHLYREFVTSGFVPTSHGEVGEDGRWGIPNTPITIGLLDAEQSGMGIEFVGIHRRDDVHRDSHFLLLRVEDEPVVLFAGSALHRYTASASCSESLHLHQRRIGGFTVYELTPYASPSVLVHLACEGSECAAIQHIECGSGY